MKKWLSMSVIAAVTLVVMFATCPAFTLRAQPRLTEAQAAALEPTPPSLVPGWGTFWSVSRPENPPLPFNPYPDLPVYRLPDGSWLFDDSTVQFPSPPPTNVVAAARNSLLQSTLASERQLLSLLENQNMFLNESESTNSPPDEDPCPPQLVDTNSVPEFGTFWFMTRTNDPPLPFDPCTGCDVYLLCNGSYLVDDTGYTWPQPSGGEDGGGTEQTNQYIYVSGDFWLEITGVSNDLANLILHGTTSGVPYTILSRRTLSSDDSWDAEAPLVGTSGQDWTAIQIPAFGRPVLFFKAVVGSVIPQRLWLCAVGISNDCFNCVLHGTTEGVNYELLSVGSLGHVNNWASETNFPGGGGQFWTPVPIPLSGRQSLFLSARSWVDSSGSGLPDWWQLQYFGHTGIDPYADPDVDGWSNLQECQNGTSPNQFDSPPAPTAWAYITGGGSSRVIQWMPASGSVQGYALVKYLAYANWPWVSVSTQVVSAATFSLSDANIQQPADDPDTNPDGFRDEYMLYALYGAGTSLPALVTDATTALSVRLVHGPGDQLQLALLSVPNGTTIIRLHLATNCPCGWGISVDHTIDLPVSAFTNNLYAFSEQEYPLYCAYQLTAQAITPDGFAGLPRVVETDCGKTIRYPFLDGSYVLKDNLMFTLQSQTAFPGGDLFPYYLVDTEGLGLAYRPGCNVRGFPCPVPVYAAASYHRSPLAWNSPNWGTTPAPLHPWEINNCLRVFEHMPSASTCWTVTNDTPFFWTDNFALCGVDGGYYFDSIGFASNSVLTACPSVLSSPSGRFVGVPMTWPNGIYNWDNFDPIDPLIDQGNGTCSIPAIHPNAYGLPLRGVICSVYVNGDWIYTPPYLPGASVPYDYNDTYFDCERFEVPSLQKEVYQFTLGGDLASISPDAASTNGGLIVSNILVASIGDPDFSVSAWLRFRLTNGTPGVYGYLDQYFDKAYRVGTNGNVTTMETGILSPYGYFFPTEPGPVALVTMPNIEDGQRGTGVVNVIKLQLDVNHDGTMDLSFGGPDNTSQARPFRFWINNDHDEPATSTEPDRDLEAYAIKLETQDWFHGRIGCKRNLEDFARLWICGLPALPDTQGYTIKLTMSPSSGNPAINLYASYDTNGSAMYLADVNAASAQFTQQYLNGQLTFDYAQKLRTIDSTQSYTLPVSVNTGRPLFTHFLFEGAGKGSGQLVLTIAQGANVIAQTSAWIDLRDVKELYQQVLVTNVQQEWPQMVEESMVSGFQVLSSPQTNMNYAKQVAVFIHGWRIPDSEYFTFSETMFKRLYWQGYSGHFAALRWRTRSGDTDPFLGLEYATYNRSEHIAFDSGAGTVAYLNDLRQRFPDCTISVCAHSMGNIVMLETLKELADAGQAPVDNYVLMQAAVPAQCYDTSITNFPDFMEAEQLTPTPNGYRNYGLNASAGLRTGGEMVNFFNPLDFALAAWELNEGFYLPIVNGPVTMKPNTLLGYYTDGTSHLLRTNYWNQSILSPFYGGYYSGPTRSVTNVYEVLPFVSRPRSKAVGAQAGTQGEIQGGEINLRNEFGFGDASSDHSAQWNRNIQDPAVGQFYLQLRRSLFPPAP